MDIMTREYLLVVHPVEEKGDGIKGIEMGIFILASCVFYIIGEYENLV